MFSRLNIALVATLVALMTHLSTTSAEPLSNLFGSKSPPVAKKVADFNETFVVGGLDFNLDGTQLATNATVDGRDVHIWDWRDHSHMVRVLHKDAAAGDGNAIQYSPDGTLLAVGHAGEKLQNGIRVIRIWNTRTGEIVHDIADAVGGSGFMSFVFSPDGKFLIRTLERVGSPGDYVVVVRTGTWEQVWGLATLPFIPRTLSISPDGQFAALGGEALVLVHPPVLPVKHHAQILIVDLAKRQVVRTIDRAFPDNNEIHTLGWSPDGKSLAAGVIVDPNPGGSYAGHDAVKIFDPATGAQLADEPGEVAYVAGLSYSPNGHYLVEGYIDGKARIWDGEHKTLLQSIPVDDHFHTVLSVSRDSRYLAIADGKHISIWELK
jgi:WD40 repeat protein